jgi:hypothetical protein
MWQSEASRLDVLENLLELLKFGRVNGNGVSQAYEVIIVIELDVYEPKGGNSHKYPSKWVRQERDVS